MTVNQVNNVDFRCLHCGSQVLANPRLSGVNNRNHCPYCLYSRHVDWKEAGDRLSPCKGPMRAVGLTLKRVKKKYGPQLGEVMLIHRCETCGQLSYNRIAADDNLEKLSELLASANKQDSDLPELDDQALELIQQGLFGRSI